MGAKALQLVEAGGGELVQRGLAVGAEPGLGRTWVRRPSSSSARRSASPAASALSSRSSCAISLSLSGWRTVFGQQAGGTAIQEEMQAWHRSRRTQSALSVRDLRGPPRHLACRPELHIVIRYIGLLSLRGKDAVMGRRAG